MVKHTWNSFNLKEKYLETVKSYRYLGVTIKYTGNLNITYGKG